MRASLLLSLIFIAVDSVVTIFIFIFQSYERHSGLSSKLSLLPISNAEWFDIKWAKQKKFLDFEWFHVKWFVQILVEYISQASGPRPLCHRVGAVSYCRDCFCHLLVVVFFCAANAVSLLLFSLATKILQEVLWKSGNICISGIPFQLFSSVGSLIKMRQGRKNNSIQYRSNIAFSLNVNFKFRSTDVVLLLTICYGFL